MDEKNYKSIIQEYEELLTLVEVVKNDLPENVSFFYFGKVKAVKLGLCRYVFIILFYINNESHSKF